jgi:hypothetical protein
MLLPVCVQTGQTKDRFAHLTGPGMLLTELNSAIKARMHGSPRAQVAALVFKPPDFNDSTEVHGPNDTPIPGRN